MRIVNLRFARRLVVGSVLAGLSSLPVSAQETYSNIVGIIPLSIPESSDVYFSFPMRQVAVFRGTVESVASGSSVEVNFDGSPFTVNAFDADEMWATHYVLAESGAARGVHFDVASNDGSSVTLSGSDAAGLAAGDTVAIHPHWTLDSAFPNGVADVEEAEAGRRSIEVIVLRNPTSSDGSGMEAANIFYYHEDAWRWVEGGLDATAGGYVIEPGDVFVIRNNGASPRTAYFTGEVTEAPIAIPVTSKSGTDYENYVTVSRPIPIALDELGLQESGVFDATTDSGNPSDTLMLYAADATGKNRSPSATYFYFNGGWRKVGESVSTDFGGDVVEPGMGIAIRKQAGIETTQNWIQEWSLPQ